MKVIIEKALAYVLAPAEGSPFSVRGQLTLGFGALFIKLAWTGQLPWEAAAPIVTGFFGVYTMARFMRGTANANGGTAAGGANGAGAAVGG